MFVQGTDKEWIDLAIENGLSKEEAERLFESLKGKELFRCNVERARFLFTILSCTNPKTGKPSSAIENRRS